MHTSKRDMAVVTLWALAVLFAPLGAEASGLPQVEARCEKNQAPLDGGVCVIRTIGSRNPDVLYYLHGRTLDERTWLDESYYTAQLRQQWADTGREAPTVVAISFGKLWLLTNKTSSPYSGLLELFTQTFMPRLEAQLGGLHGRRFLVGESMGGLNAAELALRTRLFERAALLCAPVMDVSPFAPATEIAAYIKRTKADPALIDDLVQIGRAIFPTEADWLEASPLALAERFDASAGAPSLYIAAGRYDAYGLYEPNVALAHTLIKRGASLDWRPQWGGHCAIDIPSLADFLTRP